MSYLGTITVSGTLFECIQYFPPDRMNFLTDISELIQREGELNWKGSRNSVSFWAEKNLKLDVDLSGLKALVVQNMLNHLTDELYGRSK